MKANGGQDAFGVAHRTVGGELADEHGCGDVTEELLGGSDEADGDAQVVGRAFLAQVGGGEVDVIRFISSVLTLFVGVGRKWNQD